MNICLLIFGFTLSETDAHELAVLGDALATSMGGHFAIHSVDPDDRIELFVAAPQAKWEAFRNSEAGDNTARFAVSLGLQVFDLVETIDPSDSFRSTNLTPTIT